MSLPPEPVAPFSVAVAESASARPTVSGSVRRGRPKGKAGAVGGTDLGAAEGGTASLDGRSTRERILDAAEAIFAREGYFAATIRGITALAGVELSLARYHFGSKDGLFQAVVERGAQEICAALDASLDVAVATHHPLTLEAVIEAFISPAAQHLGQGDPAWLRYVQLTAGLGTLLDRPELVTPFRDRYMRSSQRYRQAMREALPGASEQTIDMGLHIMGVLVGHAMQDLSVTRFISGGVIGEFGWTDWRRQLVLQIAGGLRAQVAT